MAPRRTVGNWEIEDVIGQGSFAIVWKARHTVTGALAAVKEINTDKLNRKLQESLNSEIAVLQRVKHVNIVGLLDLFKEPGRLYLVLEYCGGGDLALHLRQRGPLPEASARYLLRQLAEGLKVMRQHSVIHRDLKPQNLLLSDSGPSPVLKIADFGFARALQPAGMAETLCGSPLYMAPEVLQLHKYDAKADLWSVGAILFELLTGKPPFNGANHLQLVQNIERGDAELPPHVARGLSPACRQLLHQLLRRNPVERITFEELFAHPFLQQGAHSSSSSSSSNTNGAATSWPSSEGGAAAHQQQGQQGPGAASPHVPVSTGAVRFIQTSGARVGSPVHPALQPPAATMQQRLGSGPGPTHPAAAGAAASRGRDSGGGAAPAAEAPDWAAGGNGGAGHGPLAISIREVTTAPSARMAAAAAVVASALVPHEQPPQQQAGGGYGRGNTHAKEGGEAAAGGSSSLDGSDDSDYVVVSSPVAGFRRQATSNSRNQLFGAGGSSSRAGSAGGAAPQSATAVVAPTADTTFRVPRTPHPAFASPTAGASAAGGGGAGGDAIPSPAPLPCAAYDGPRPPSWQQAFAIADGSLPLSGKQHLPIAAATLPAHANTNDQPLSYTSAAVPAAGAAAAQGQQQRLGLAGAAGTGTYGGLGVGVVGGNTLTLRLPGQEEPDLPLLQRVIHSLLDLAKSRCTALLDTEAELRQQQALEQQRTATGMGMGFGGAGGASKMGVAAMGEAPTGGSGGEGEAELEEGAAQAVGTLLVACRLLAVAVTVQKSGGAGGKSGGGGSLSHAPNSPLPYARLSSGVAGELMDATVPAAGSRVRERSDGGSAFDAAGSDAGSGSSSGGGADSSPPPSPASASAMAALADHARTALAALDEHMGGTVAQLLMQRSASDALPSASSFAPSPAATALSHHTAAPAPSLRPVAPDSPRHPAAVGTTTTANAAAAAAPAACAAAAPPPPLLVPCAVDTLLAAAVHHSRAAAGEELLGNAAGAVQEYDKAADLLAFLMAAAPPGPADGNGGAATAAMADASSVGGQSLSQRLEAVRPPLVPHDRQRLMKYYAAVRLRQQSAAMAVAAGGRPAGVLAVGTTTVARHSEGGIGAGGGVSLPCHAMPHGPGAVPAGSLPSQRYGQQQPAVGSYGRQVAEAAASGRHVSYGHSPGYGAAVF